MIEIGVFGSVFDPPTLGHKDVIEQSVKHFDRIILVPSAAHAFSKQPLPFAQRLQMLKRFVEVVSLSVCQLEISDIESQMLAQRPNQPIYSFDVLSAIEATHPDVSITFIRGPDNAAPAIWHRFYRYQDIETRWSLFTAIERIDVRSSHVRHILKNSELSEIECRQALDNLVIPEIRDLILSEKFYRPPLHSNESAWIL
ncbi:MAG: adenylyltransferase/cytidyltransferase family protein [Endozoicomonadaceae bacterium]|nr:adenylyltransferase/cytidyltransferase family protein [Endozoicomonadaceae bacterium]